MSVVQEREKPLVLVADDDVDILALVAYRLERAGYDGVTATNGEDAAELALDRLPDLAVLDVMMPRLDGYGVTRRIRDHVTTNTIPVILLTARVQEADIARGFEAGADDYIKKPFSPQEIPARVRIQLGRRAGLDPSWS